jgi:hypothetical protein
MIATSMASRYQRRYGTEMDFACTNEADCPARAALRRDARLKLVGLEARALGSDSPYFMGSCRWKHV